MFCIKSQTLLASRHWTCTSRESEGERRILTPVAELPDCPVWSWMPCSQWLDARMPVSWLVTEKVLWATFKTCFLFKGQSVNNCDMSFRVFAVSSVSWEIRKARAEEGSVREIPLWFALGAPWFQTFHALEQLTACTILAILCVANV